MTMLSAQPITLTGEQHDRLWQAAKAARRCVGLACTCDENPDTNLISHIGGVADAIERILIDAQDAAPPATASSGEAA